MNPELKKFRGFAIASSLCALVSLFVGGSMLDLVGFILGFYSYTKVKNLQTENSDDTSTQAVLRLARNSVWFCVIAAVLNLIAAFMMLPSIMDEVSGTGTSSSAF